MSKHHARVTRVLTLALASTVLSVSAPRASAQLSTDVVRPPKVNEPGAGQTWLYYLVGLGFGAAAVGITIMPSRRTHQD